MTCRRTSYSHHTVGSYVGNAIGYSDDMDKELIIEEPLDEEKEEREAIIRAELLRLVEANPGKTLEELTK